MKAKRLDMTADDLVHLLTARIDTIRSGWALQEKSALMALAIDWAIRFGASTTVHDELIALALTDPLTGVNRAICLAPRASEEMKDKIMSALFGFLEMRDVDRVFGYAREVLHRECTFAECQSMAKWFSSSCSTTSEKRRRQKLVEYIAEYYPEELEGVNKYFEKEDRFWNGVGGAL